MKKLKMALLASVLGLVLTQLGHTQGSLLWSKSINDSFTSADVFNRANFWLDYEHTNPPAGYFEPLFNQISFGTNDVGRTFTVASTADDPDFAAVVNELTNGVEQYMVFFLGNFSNQVGVAYTYSESQLFSGIGTGPDLIGYQIQSFGLHIDSLSIGSRPGGGTDFSGRVTLSIYCTPVPEPSASAVILLGSGVLTCLRRRSRRRRGLP